MKNSKGRILLRVVFLASLTLVSFFCIKKLFAANSSINFLPREEKVESYSKSYSTVLSKSSLTCDAADALQYKVDRCQACVNDFKPNCPDCCLRQIGTKNVKKCHVLDTVAGGGSEFRCLAQGIDCSSPPFDSQTCNSAKCPTNPLDVSQSPLTTCRYDVGGNLKLNGEIEAWYNLPCDPGSSKVCNLTGEPYILGGQCVEKTAGSGIWTCNRDVDEGDLKAKHVSGCDTLTGACTNCANLTDVYTKSTSSVTCPTPIPPGFRVDDTCFDYTVKPLLTNCIANCVDYSKKWEEFNKKSYCCKEAVCSGTGEAGVNGSGWDNNCNEDACQARIVWHECNPPDHSLSDEMCCNNLDNDDCTRFQREMAACMNSGADCPNCFAEIDSNFKFDFVARSREKLVVIWQIDATPSFTPTSPPPNSNFYTMVKIFKVLSDGSLSASPVHTSVVHAKSFAAAFSIYAATSTDGMSPGFETGEKYSVRLYYFLPGSTGYTVSTSIRRMEFIVFKVRE